MESNRKISERNKNYLILLSTIEISNYKNSQLIEIINYACSKQAFSKFIKRNGLRNTETKIGILNILKYINTLDYTFNELKDICKYTKTTGGFYNLLKNNGIRFRKMKPGRKIYKNNYKESNHE